MKPCNDPSIHVGFVTFVFFIGTINGDDYAAKAGKRKLAKSRSDASVYSENSAPAMRELRMCSLPVVSQIGRC
jgi:hypothetical protein